ncbi:MAG: hypothetical protein J6T57_00600 [Alphaproteobacteria bacterium]|nr:hypothetical protein [Alphaproteobacteria bacterium]
MANSMSRERENSLMLNMTEYDIAGNSFRAWHDGAGNLVFVVDDTIDEYKPNVLLVIGDYGDRKWDDVLVNDYHLDLELVRPRRENLYQKLDIEYGGLENYENLIRAYNDGGDVDAAVADLLDFRDAAVRRAATERLTGAEEIIEQATATIERTERTIYSFNMRLRKLAEKLSKQKANVGREPTKQSASKILRSEYRIDSTNEKLARAEKRIENAKRRIEVARVDADAARELLSRRRPVVHSKNVKDVEIEPKTDVPSDVARPTDSVENKKLDTAPVFTVPEYEFKPEPRDEEMPESEEEVKPLFDKDPEILDDEIAFKPVAFDDIKPRESTAMRPESPMSHDDIDRDRYEYKPENEDNDVASSGWKEQEEKEPVLDTIDSVAESVPADTDTTGAVDNTQYSNVSPVNRPVSNVGGVATLPMAPSRPISPITGSNGKVKPVGGHSRPNVAYYLLLVLLIALSIFTLWLYQKKNGGTVPFIGDSGTKVVVTQPDVLSAGTPIREEPKPVVASTSVPEPVIVHPVVEPVVAPAPVPVHEPEPEPVQDTPIKVVYPNEDILRGPEPDVPVVESEEDVLARKDAYGVSREDKPVLVPVESVAVSEPAVVVTNVTAPDVIFEDDVISVPVRPVPESAEYYDDGMGYNDVVVDNNFNTVYDNSYVEETGGFVDDPASYNAAGPETVHQLTIHDGGQYSVSYDETVYQN